MKHDENWLFHYQLLQNFYQEHYHSDVPSDYVVSYDDKEVRLGYWVINQRRAYQGIYQDTATKLKIYPWQVSLLDKLEFTWDLRKKVWYQKFRLVQQFYQEHGHLSIPSYLTYTLNDKTFSLRKWWQTQKTAYKKYCGEEVITGSRLDHQQALLLETIGIEQVVARKVKMKAPNYLVQDLLEIFAIDLQELSDVVGVSLEKENITKVQLKTFCNYCACDYELFLRALTLRKNGLSSRPLSSLVKLVERDRQLNQAHWITDQYGSEVLVGHLLTMNYYHKEAVLSVMKQESVPLEEALIEISLAKYFSSQEMQGLVQAPFRKVVSSLCHRQIDDQVLTSLEFVKKNLEDTCYTKFVEEAKHCASTIRNFYLFDVARELSGEKKQQKIARYHFSPQEVKQIDQVPLQFKEQTILGACPNVKPKVLLKDNLYKQF